MSDTENLQAVFSALSPSNEGLVDVSTFQQAFKKFDKRATDFDISELIKIMDPSNTGHISFESFCDGITIFNEKSTLLSNERYVDAFYVSNGADADSSCTIDSGINCSKEEDFHHESFMNHTDPALIREDVRRTWPKRRHRPNEADLLAHPSINQEYRSHTPLSGSYSDIICANVDDTMRDLRDKLERLENCVGEMSTRGASDSHLSIAKLREENATLSTRLQSLEDVHKEKEESYLQTIESQKTFWKQSLDQLNRDKSERLEEYQSRLNSLDKENTQLRSDLLKSTSAQDRLKNELDRVESLWKDSEIKICNLKEDMQSLIDLSQKEISLITRDRDTLASELNLLKDTGELDKSASAQVTLAAAFKNHQEMQIYARKLSSENRTLRSEIEELETQLLQLSIDEGKNLISYASTTNFMEELDNMTKLEVIELLVKEKDANCKLRQYVEKLITTIMENHPSLLEIKGSS